MLHHLLAHLDLTLVEESEQDLVPLQSLPVVQIPATHTRNSRYFLYCRGCSAEGPSVRVLVVNLLNCVCTGLYHT